MALDTSADGLSQYLRLLELIKIAAESSDENHLLPDCISPSLVEVLEIGYRRVLQEKSRHSWDTIPDLFGRYDPHESRSDLRRCWETLDALKTLVSTRVTPQPSASEATNATDPVQPAASPSAHTTTAPDTD